MDFSTAVHLIEKGILRSDSPQQWVDLGAGDGLFTRALASLLPASSSVLAIDRNGNSLKSIEWNLRAIQLQTKTDDFTSMRWGENFDGILMANALHYVKNQADFLLKLKNRIISPGRLVVVEYERRQPNAWVPYPISFKKLKEEGERVGFSLITQLTEVPSIYEGAAIYSAALMLTSVSNNSNQEKIV